MAYVENLPTAIKAASAVKLPHSRIIVLDGHKSQEKLPFKTVQDLVDEKSLPPYVPYTFAKPKQAREKVAFLCFSSGTTGNPKVRASAVWG